MTYGWGNMSKLLSVYVATLWKGSLRGFFLFFWGWWQTQGDHGWNLRLGMGGLKRTERKCGKRREASSRGNSGIGKTDVAWTKYWPTNKPSHHFRDYCILRQNGLLWRPPYWDKFKRTPLHGFVHCCHAVTRCQQRLMNLTRFWQYRLKHSQCN